MTIGQDIVNWAKVRPPWQQRILQILAAGDAVTETDVAKVIDEIIAPSPTARQVAALDLALAPPDEEQVSLLALRDCKGVNALVDGKELTFSKTGLNIVYGDNGSGKSGYARLIKEIVGARHPSSILPNVFEEAPSEPSAVLAFAVADEEHEQKYPGVPDASVKKMSFYDEHCGDVYLTSKSVVTYRPSALVILDGLIEVCDRLRNAISTRLAVNQQSALDLDLPPDTAAAVFVQALEPGMPDELIDTFTTPIPDAATKRAEAATEVARLENSDATKERLRLQTLAAACTTFAQHLMAISKELDESALIEAEEEVKKATSLRDVAKTAATADFSQELDGVGGSAWRALWQAARAYSVAEAYHDEAFPVTHGGSRCVLCQQPLDASASERLQRFDAYMRDTTERDASRAEAVAKARLDRLASLTVTSTAHITQMSLLTDAEPGLAVSIGDAIEACELTKSTMPVWLTTGKHRPSAIDTTAIIKTLEEAAESYTETAAKVDVAAFQTALLEAQKQRREIEASIKLSESSNLLKAEVKRLVEHQTLRAALSEVSTTSITAKSTQLTKLYAGDVIKNEFVRETERLHLQRVTIQDLGGHKGQLEQQPGLLGAKAAKVRAVQVLSEGEQTAMGLAGFFTEASFDSSKSSLILDDPVTSLDHVRRGYVAARLADLSKDRQVIVFTHDVTFAGELLRHAKKAGVTATTRSVERHGLIPGHLRMSLPWKAKDFKARLHDIEQQLVQLTKDRDSYGQEDWEEAVCSWAGRLSELWESCVSTEILDEVFDRGTAQVRTLKFHILAAVTQQDDQEFEAGYGACSTWARRHNKAPEVNYVPPEPADMKAEVERVREWQKRVRKYRD